MNDREVIGRIGALVDEEHELERQAGPEGLGPEADARRREIEVALDQCWDLLRQRRAKRHAGQDPDEANVRDAGIVEGYRQ